MPYAFVTMLYVSGPPGSGPISQRYGSGSGSFYHQAKTVRKTWIPTALTFFYFLSLKNDVNEPSKSNVSKINFNKKLFLGWSLEGQRRK